jgi:hypothetical protein
VNGELGQNGQVDVIGERFHALLYALARLGDRSMLAEVFSVHERAVNLRLSEGESKPRLVSMITDRSSMTRNSLLLAPENRPLETLGLKPREQVSLSVELRGDSLAIALSPATGANAGRPVVRATGEPALYTGRIDPAFALGSAAVRRDTLVALGRTILAAEDGTGFGSLAHAALVALSNSARPGDDAPIPKVSDTRMEHEIPKVSDTPNPFAARAKALLEPAIAGTTPLHELLRSLVGLGIGFTPSGDDFGAGALAAYALLGRRPPRASRDALLSQARAATTLPGSVLLIDAADGSFPAYLRDFARSFANSARSADALTPAVERAAAHGHTSGIDALTGFLLALAIGQT